MRTLRSQFPDLWQQLQDLDNRQMKPFKDGKSVLALEKRFALEDVLQADGESISNRAFFKDLKRHIAGEVTAEEILKERREKRAA